MVKKMVGIKIFGFLTLFGLAFLAHSVHASATGSIPVGTVLSEFKLEAPTTPVDQEYLGLKGVDSFTLTQISGKLVIIDFISVWCTVCHKAAPIVNRLHNAIREDTVLNKDIKIMGIAVGNDDKEIAVYRKKFKVSFPVLPDKDETAFKAVNVPVTPYMIGTNKEGKVLMNHVGVIDDLYNMLNEIRELHKLQK